jgi:hypothetical protein
VAKKKKPLHPLKPPLLLHLHLLQLRPLLLHPLQQKPLLLHLLRLLLNQQNSNALRLGHCLASDQQKNRPRAVFFVCASQFPGMGNAVL